MKKFVALSSALFFLGACGGGSSESADSSGLTAEECQSFGFTGTASRIADDGFGQAAGDYTGDDFTDVVSEGGNWFKILAASYPVETSDAGSTADVPDGGVAIRIDFAEGTTGATGDLGWGNPGLPPLVSNGGSGANQEDTVGTYTVIEAASGAICVQVTYTDTHQSIDGVFVARFSE